MKSQRWFIHLLFALVLLILNLSVIDSQQDYAIYGLFDYYKNAITARSTNVIYSRCFYGVGLTTCAAKQADDDFVAAYDLPYLATIKDYYGSTYCTQCCGSPPDDIDTWDLYCPMINVGSLSQVNLYGYELRMARRRTTADTTVITCPLRRSACTYTDAGATIACDRSQDKTYLAGYTLRLTVVQWDSMFSYWRGVESCEIEVDEQTYESSLPSNVTFHEKIIMTHTPLKYPAYDYGKILIVLVFVVFIVYILLYFCRRKRCPYCQNKLVLSINLCMVCRFYGVKPPDPVLLRALESKGDTIQGPIPERFPGAKLLVGLLRFSLSWVFSCCFRSSQAIKVHPIVVYKANLELVGKEKQAAAAIIDIEESKLDKELDEMDDDENDRNNVPETDTTVATKPKKLTKYEKLRVKWEKQRVRAMEKNANVLDYNPELIFQAVDHPKFMEFKPSHTAPKQVFKKSPYEFP